MRAAAAAAAAAASRRRCEAFPATPELPEEIRAAAHAAAVASSPEDAFVAALAAGAAGAAASGGRTRPWTNPPTTPGAVPGPDTESPPGTSGRLERERVLRFDPHRGAAGAFYFDDTSDTASEARSTRESAAWAERTVRRVLGVPEPEKEKAPPHGVSLAAATCALVGLDDDMTAYGARATSARLTISGADHQGAQSQVPWWERGGSATLSNAASSESALANGVDGSFAAAKAPRGDAGAETARRKASAFAPVRGEGEGRLATIAARMARDDAYAERADAAPRSPHVPAPPASLVAAAARARVRESIEEAPIAGADVRNPSRPPASGRPVLRTVASPLVTTSATRNSRACSAATAGGPGEDRDAADPMIPTKSTREATREKRRPLDPTRLSRAHAAVRAAAAAVDAALASDARADAEDAVPDTPPAEAIEEEQGTPTVSAAEEAREDAPSEPPREPAASREADPADDADDGAIAFDATKRDAMDEEPSSSSSPREVQRARPTARSVAFDADLIDLVDEVDELRLFPGDAESRERGGRLSFESLGARRRPGGDAARPANPRAAAAAAARRVAGRVRALPEKARRRRLADEVTRRETQRRRHRGAAEKAEWRVDYRSFSEGKRGEPLL